MIGNIDEIGQEVRAYFDEADGARERVLGLARQVTRASAETIRAIHRGEHEQARERMAATRDTVQTMQQVLTERPEAWNSTFVLDAIKEHAEAVLTLALVTGEPLPLPSQMGVPVPAFINGLAEAVGECRRSILDAIRQTGNQDCERLLDSMDQIYQVLVTMDYPDAVTKGLRQRTDAARAILERTRGDLTTAERQRALQKALSGVEERLTEVGL